jgi:hypothetical protein
MSIDFSQRVFAMGALACPGVEDDNLPIDEVRSIGQATHHDGLRPIAPGEIEADQGSWWSLERERESGGASREQATC